MANCKQCNKVIPDGTEYCSECQEKESGKLKESYLDSLLNSVKDTKPGAEDIYKKNTKPKRSASEDDNIAHEPEEESEDIFPVSEADLEDFEEYNIDADIEAFNNDEFNNDDFISEEELYGQSLSDFHSQDDNEVKSDVEKEATETEELTNEKPIDEKSIEEKSIEEQPVEEQLTDGQLSEEEPLHNDEQETEVSEEAQVQEEDELQQDEGIGLSTMDDLQAETAGTLEAEEIEDTNEIEGEEDSLTDALHQVLNQEELLEDENFDPGDISDFLNNVDDSDVEPLSDSMTMIGEEDAKQLEETEATEQTEEEEDLLSLLNQIEPDDPVASDVKAINNMLQGIPVEEEFPADVGEVFSDALQVVTDLDDPSLEEASLGEQVVEIENEKKDRKAKKQKLKEKMKAELAAKEDKANDQPKKGFWQRLFANIEEDDEDESSIFSLGGTSKSSEKKSKKKAKKKNENASSTDGAENLEDALDDKKVKKALKKKEKQEKKKKAKEVIEVLDEIDEDKGRINRVGAAIVFIFFGLLALIVLVGTNVATYNLHINNASKYFEYHKYTEAYNEIYGIDVDEKDEVLYNKIMTVMYVNKQLNSYHSYYEMKKYPEALDSLLKGLNRYDRYIELATMLGIDDDMDYVRNQILSELDSVFHLTEEEALQIASMEDIADYSKKVYEVALQNMNN
ncbi:hypothetical protein H0486_12510 [Lachnospiraceae bacterium MD1]|uniref:Uncharacterized protein n=1 Tax=Variimorphobacter saccharofermentans TaxID=2755051 RepID=A0A839K2W5_9FIRM|nr:hypothetical protein [Variimorphobacter saccharofermentans]MBB2183697.1 hypothetical protein [Variimorphobacter saccharofermentans]